MSDEFVYFTCFVAALIWLISKSPLLRWVVMFSLVAGWGLVAVGAPLFVALAIHAPKGDYIAAVVTVLAGFAALGSMWFAYGWPWLLDIVRGFKGSMSLWDRD